MKKTHIPTLSYPPALADIKIEKGIPFPRRGKWRKLASVMVPGDSVLLDSYGHATALRNAIVSLGFGSHVRMQENGKIRVWKIEAE